MSEDLVGLGVGGVRRGSREALVGNATLPLELVDLNMFLSLAAACSAKKIMTLLDAVEAVGVAVYARGDAGSGRVDYLEVEVEALGGVGEGEVLGAFWQCPVMGFLRDKVRGVRVSVRRT